MQLLRSGLMRQLAIVAALAALLTCALVIVMSRAASARHSAADDVASATQTLVEAELLERHLVDLETGLRGYVPTGDRLLLVPFNFGRGAIPGEYAALRRLIAGQPAQKRRLAAIERSVADYTSGYALPLIARSPVTGRRLDAVTRRGKQLFDGLRVQLSAFDAGQIAIQGAAERRESTAEHQFSLVMIGTVAGLLIVIVGLVLYIGRVVIVPVRRVIVACAELAAGRRSGDLRVDGAPELRTLMAAFNVMAAELEERERKLLGRERMLAESQAIAHVGSWELDVEQSRLVWSDELCRIYGQPIGSKPTIEEFMEMVHPEDRDAVAEHLEQVKSGADNHSEYRIVRSDGVVRHVHTARFGRADEHGAVAAVVGTTQDITERRDYEDRLKHLAEHDPLTGLHNRRAFELALEAHLGRCRRYGATGALLILDLDGFKLVNDTHGHAVGDELLRACADALKGRLRETDVLARLGGDEFAVLLPAEDGPAADIVARALGQTVREAGGFGAANSASVSASIGIAVFEEDTATADEILANADQAMYAAKEAGKDRSAVHGSGGCTVKRFGSPAVPSPAA